MEKAPASMSETVTVSVSEMAKVEESGDWSAEAQHAQAQRRRSAVLSL
jgi:hypothetical protein